MLQRLILPLALRSLIVSVVIATILLIFFAPVRLLRGEQAMSATLREFSAGVSWVGHAISSSESFDPATCSRTQTCEVFTLKVDVSDQYRQQHPDFALSIRLAWDDPQNDFDLYVSKDGRTLEESNQAQTNSEELRVDRPANGTYQVFAHTAAAANATVYNGEAKIIAGASGPSLRHAQYTKDPDGKYGPEMFQFSPEVQLDKNDKNESLTPSRTSIAIDAFGNTYVATNGESLSLADPQYSIGTLYSRPSPEWAAAAGASRLYVAFAEGQRTMLRRSNDGGRTFDRGVLIARVPSPEMGRGLGNLITNGSGTVYNVFTGAAGNDIYLAKCVEPCQHFVTRRIFVGKFGESLSHSYPVVALDHAGGLHVAFSDGTTVFLTSSADGGATWRDPVAVNNAADAETAAGTSPWIVAGDSGRLGILWLSPQGETYYSFTPDAFASAPSFNYVKVADSQPNANLPSAASDASGNANLVYGHTRLLRQVAGERLLFGPVTTTIATTKTQTGMKGLSFSVRQDLSGTLTYVDEQRRTSLQCAHFTSFKQAEQKVSISGNGRLQDGSQVSFTVVASDSSAKARSFSIAMSNGYFAAAELQATLPSEVKLQKTERRSD